MKKLRFLFVLWWVVLFFQNFWIDAVLGHEGYITTYNHHIEKGEFEVMLMNDFTLPSDHKREKDGQKSYLSQMLELEYAPTDQWALELMVEGFEEPSTGETKFTGARYETRYRIFENEVPLNPVLYLEYEDLDPKTRYKMEVSGWIEPPYEEAGGKEPEREAILESRFILSQDVNRWNMAFNWINESDLNSGITAFGYSTGVLYRLSEEMDEEGCHHPGQDHKMEEVEEKESEEKFVRPVSLSFELLGALGDTRRFDLRPSKQEHYFQPAITLHMGENTMVTTGFAIGLTEDSDNIARFNLGWMF